MSLEAELALFASKKDEWLKEHEGRFVVIKEASFSFHDSDQKAYQAGLDQFGEVGFLIKQVLPEDLTEESPALFCGLLSGPT